MTQSQSLRGVGPGVALQDSGPDDSSISAHRNDRPTVTLLWRLVLALLFAAIFTSIGWKEINPFAFPDLENYRAGFDSHWFVFQSLNLTPLDFFVSEGVWVRGFDALTSYVGNIDTSFDIVSFVAVTLIAWYVIAETPSPLYLPLLINPGFVNLIEEQIRSGLATGIFLLAVRSRGIVSCLFWTLLAASLHTAFFLFGSILLFHRLARNLPSYRAIMLRPIAGGLTVIVAAGIITLLRTFLLSALGDARAFSVEEYNSGILLSLAWVLLGAWFALQLRGALLAFESMFLLFCSVLAFVSALEGVYGARFFVIAATAFPVLVSRVNLLVRWPTVAAYAVFAGTWFVLWFQ